MLSERDPFKFLGRNDISWTAAARVVNRQML